MMIVMIGILISFTCYVTEVRGEDLVIMLIMYLIIILIYRRLKYDNAGNGSL